MIGFDPANRHVLLGDGTIPYDTLIVAAGARHHYFGHAEWEELAPGLKTIEDATEMRRRIFLAFEAAEREPDSERQRAWLTFVIIGAGPTGVELAGALSEITRHTLKRDFRTIDTREARIILVEAADRVLPAYPADLSSKAAAALQRLGVDLRTRRPGDGRCSPTALPSGSRELTATSQPASCSGLRASRRRRSRAPWPKRRRSGSTVPGASLSSPIAQSPVIRRSSSSAT